MTFAIPGAARQAAKSFCAAGLALVLTAHTALCAESDEAKSFEKLESSLTQAIMTADWKGLEQVAKGYRDAHATADDLEMSILRAETRAALDRHEVPNDAVTRAQIEIWGQAVRVLTGDEKSRERLRALLSEKFVLPFEWTNASRPTKAEQKKYHDAELGMENQKHALLCLALLKEPGVVERVLATLRDPQKQPAFVHGMSSEGLSTDDNLYVFDVLVADPKDGWKSLIDFLSEEPGKTVFMKQHIVLNKLIFLTHFHAHYANYDGVFDKVEADAAAALPKDAAQQLVKALAVFIGHWPKEIKTLGTNESSIAYTIKAAIDQIPDVHDDAGVIAAFKGLQDKFTNAMAKKEVAAILKEIGADGK
jgi:hypothetical protein